MHPGTVLVFVALGAAVIWIMTDPGGLSSLFAGVAAPGGGSVTTNAAGRPFLDETQLNYYMEPFGTRHITSAGAAAIGAQAGAPLAGATFGISLGVGALVGWLSGVSSNDTKEDREKFAKRLGFLQLGGEVNQAKSAVTSPDGRGSLYGYLNFINAGALTHVGLNVIGRKDFEGNAKWGIDVLVALWQSNYSFPR